MTRAAFQGVAGAYSEEAIRQFFGPEVESVPCRTLADVFVAVERHDMGLLRRSSFVRLLGSHPAATTAVPDNGAMASE